MNRSRSNSRSKWMDVLGFEDGSSDGHSSSSNSSRQSSDLPSIIHYFPNPYTSLSQQPQSQPAYPSFARDMTFFRSSDGDMLLSPTAPPQDIRPLFSPPEQFHITIQLASHPDILLHTGPDKSSPIIAYARTYTSGAASLSLCPLPSPKTLIKTLSLRSRPSTPNFSLPRSKTPMSWSSNTPIPTSALPYKPVTRTEKLSSTTTLFSSVRYLFFHTSLPTHTRERFEWRSTISSFRFTSSSNDSTRDNKGMRLVRCSTGETVAVYAGLEGRNVSDVVGMFRFLDGEEDVRRGLGRDWEVLALLSVLCAVEGQKGERKGLRLDYFR